MNKKKKVLNEWMKEKNVRGHYTFTHIAKENLLCKVLTINCERSHFPILQDYRKFIERLTILRCYLPRHMVLRIPFFPAVQEMQHCFSL